MWSLVYLVVRALVGFLVSGGQRGRADGAIMDTASRIPDPEPQEAAMTRSKRSTSDTPPPHREAAFGGAIAGAIAGEVTGAIVGSYRAQRVTRTW